VTLKTQFQHIPDKFQNLADYLKIKKSEILAPQLIFGVSSSQLPNTFRWALGINDNPQGAV
jgi:hypothetical protein